MTASQLQAVGGLLLVNVAWLSYLALIPREKVPAKPHLFSLAMVAGAGLSLWSLWPSLSGAAPHSSLLWLLAGLTVALAFFFFFLLAQAPMPDGAIRVEVGGKLIAFEAVDGAGQSFASSSLAGQAVLLKFFRGHW